ncbi:PapD-like protein [Syncephalastrum racemosum]|uniref:PapD-like protein n=1 Tax=Syncephalastrum racemosum TaxID=13706 RepID=A0A1X2HHI1_SYNRA|nr:PapD-like protein [Syncephalastrum racemosum]
MSVILEPSTHLTFGKPSSPLDQQVAETETLCVKNPGLLPIAFKIKTTAPKHYCVRPNAGKIPPGEQVHIQVFLQPLRSNSKMMKEDYKCKDKFLVQTIELKPDFEDYSPSTAELWDRVEKENIQYKKLKCVYRGSIRRKLEKEPSNELVIIPQEKSKKETDTRHTVKVVEVDKNNKEGEDMPKKEQPVNEEKGQETAQGQVAIVENQEFQTTPKKTEVSSLLLLPPSPPVQPNVNHNHNDGPLDKIQTLERELERLRTCLKEQEARCHCQQTSKKEVKEEKEQDAVSITHALGAAHRHLALLEDRRCNHHQGASHPRMEEEGYPVFVVWAAACLTFGIAYLFF